MQPMQPSPPPNSPRQFSFSEAHADRYAFSPIAPVDDNQPADGTTPNQAAVTLLANQQAPNVRVPITWTLSGRPSIVFTETRAQSWDTTTAPDGTSNATFIDTEAEGGQIEVGVHMARLPEVQATPKTFTFQPPPADGYTLSVIVAGRDFAAPGRQNTAYVVVLNDGVVAPSEPVVWAIEGTGNPAFANGQQTIETTAGTSSNPLSPNVHAVAFRNQETGTAQLRAHLKNHPTVISGPTQFAWTSTPPSEYTLSEIVAYRDLAPSDGQTSDTAFAVLLRGGVPLDTETDVFAYTLSGSASAGFVNGQQDWSSPVVRGIGFADFHCDSRSDETVTITFSAYNHPNVPPRSKAFTFTASDAPADRWAFSPISPVRDNQPTGGTRADQAQVTLTKNENAPYAMVPVTWTLRARPSVVFSDTWTQTFDTTTSGSGVSSAAFVDTGAEGGPFEVDVRMTRSPEIAADPATFSFRPPGGYTLQAIIAKRDFAAPGEPNKAFLIVLNDGTIAPSERIVWTIEGTGRPEFNNGQQTIETTSEIPGGVHSVEFTNPQPGAANVRAHLKSDSTVTAGPTQFIWTANPPSEYTLSEIIAYQDNVESDGRLFNASVAILLRGGVPVDSAVMTYTLSGPPSAAFVGSHHAEEESPTVEGLAQQLFICASGREDNVTITYSVRGHPEVPSRSKVFTFTAPGYIRVEPPKQRE